MPKTQQDLLSERRRLKAEVDKIIKDAGDNLPNSDGQKKLDEIRTKADDLDTRIENQALLDQLDRMVPGTTLSGSGDQAWDGQLREFRLARLMSSVFEPSVDAGLEKEVCAEQRRRTGKTGEGFLVPFEGVRPRGLERRVLTVSGDASNLISTNVMGNEFIDALRPASVATRLGARVITVERSDIALPRRDTRSPNAGWYVENNAINSGDQSFDQVTGTPHHLGLITEFGRKTLLQTSPDIEQLTREHFMAELGVALDLGTLKGSGMSGQPTGITETSNIGTATSSSSAPTWAQLLAVEATVEAADVSPESFGWVMNAYLKAAMRGTTKVSMDASAGFIMENPRTLDGYPVGISSQLVGFSGSPAVDAEAIFGAWNQVIVAMWSGIEILVNPYEFTAYSKGNVSVRGLVDADVLVRHPEAFVHWSDIQV